MRTDDRDPVSSVKAYLQNGAPRVVSKNVALDLRDIKVRLDRARQTERRIQISEQLRALFQSADLPPA
jgi:hypothetical protein